MAPPPSTVRASAPKRLTLVATALLVTIAASQSARGSGVDAARPEPAPSSRWSGIQIVVFKSKRRLAVYRDGRFVKEYAVVLGLAPSGRKRHENDARTPEGSYRIVGKRPHERWQRFLAIDYPNAADVELYQSEAARGVIPGDADAPFAIGGGLGIHGNDRPEEQARGVDWTKGCIAMSATDVEELDAMVPVESRVWIVE